MKIWIDLTDFLNWRGNLTGIQRIQYNISKLYVDSNKDVHFFIYKESSRSFCEVEFNPDKIVKSGIVIEGSSSSTARFYERVIRYLKKKAYAKYPDKSNLLSHPKQECLFNKNDVVLIMGGIWVGNYINDLEYYKQRKNFKLVHFIFDMIPSFFPGYVVDWLPEAFNYYNRKVFSMAEGVLSISRSTADDVIKFIKINSIKNMPEIKIIRIGEGIDTTQYKTDKSFKSLVGEKYILSVSTIEGRKNHAAFFYVVKEAKRRGVEIPKIVIVGRNGWLTEDIRSIIKNDYDAKEKIILMNDVSDGELDWLYRNCMFTVFPSFYEGWGMPVAESLAYGKLCLSSNTSSMPEIAGDLIDYFSPYNTGEIVDCILKYLDKNELDKKEKIIQAKYHQTSWAKMFSDIDAFVGEIATK